MFEVTKIIIWKKFILFFQEECIINTKYEVYIFNKIIEMYLSSKSA